MCTRLKGGRALGGRFSTALGRGNYHSGLISVRQGGHYIGCGEGQPEADHIVVGCFDQDARTLTGFLEIHGPDLASLGLWSAQDALKGTRPSGQPPRILRFFRPVWESF